MTRQWRWLLGALAVVLGLALVAGWLVTRVDAPVAAEDTAVTAPARAKPVEPAVGQAPSVPAAPSTPVPGTPPGAASAPLPPPAPPAAHSGGSQGTAGRPEGDRDRSGADVASSDAHADAGVVHKLDRVGIQSAIQEKIPQIKECYESWLGMNPQLAGKLLVGFRIVANDAGTEGAVGEIAIADGGMGHVAMEGCVMNVMSDMRFEAPKDGEVVVNYPLRFNSEPDKK